VYYLGVQVFNMLPSYIKTEFDNSKKLKVILQKFLLKIPFIPWMNFLNYKKVNSTLGQTYERFGMLVPLFYLPICTIYWFVYVIS